MRGWGRWLRSLIHPFTVQLFLFGASAGFLTALVYPRIGELYLAMYGEEVRFYVFRMMVEYGSMGAVLAVFSRNMLLAAVLTLAPCFISFIYRYGGEGLDRSLTAFSTCATLAYGFAPYGLILGHLYTRCQVEEFLRWILYLAPHAPLEASAILYAASLSLQVRDAAWRGGLAAKLATRSISQAARRVLASGIVLAAAALLETFLSPMLL